MKSKPLVTGTQVLRSLRHRLQNLEHSSALGQRVASKTRSLVDQVVRHRPVDAVLDFAQAAHDASAELHADVYVACDVGALPAAHILARTVGGRVVGDVREVPRLDQRSLPKAISPVDMLFLNRANMQLLHDCDALMTVGETLGAELADLGLSASVVPNYLPQKTPKPDGSLHRRVGIAADARIVTVPNTVVGGADGLVEALADLPADTHLVFVGNTKPFTYRDHLRQVAVSAGVSKRTHWIDPVPYHELKDLLADAHIGVVLLDPAIPNHRVAFPNRLFDVLASELPVATSEVTDVASVVRRFSAGVVVAQNTRSDWSHALNDALANHATLRAGAIAASHDLTWASIEPDLLGVLQVESGQRVTFLHVSNLHRNQRTLRMIDTLHRHGVASAIGTSVGAAQSGLPVDYRLVDLSR